MKFIDSLVIAFKSLSSNKLRSGLTMLGVIIGVGAVIALMAVGQGAQASITATVEELGTNILYVMPTSAEGGGMRAVQYGSTTPTLTLDDAKALERIPGVVSVSPVNENLVEISAGSENMVVIIHGATADYQSAYNYSVAQGQFISDRNVTSRDMVVVLGSDVAEELFGSADPVGQKVKIKGKRFTVIGVLEAKGGAFMGVSMDEIAVTPITTFQSRLFTQRTPSGEDAVQSIAVQVGSADDLETVRGNIEDTLRKRHHIQPGDEDDFTTVSQEQFLSMFKQITGIFTVVLGAIASISLIVGSIGIMNIMLVSVTERTREIGIRKAVGAKRRDILMQFLLEAAMLSLVGGAIGIIGGWLLATVVSLIDFGTFTLHAAVSPGIVILAISVSIFIGLASGIYPAMRAARLDPIEALHYG